MATLLQAIAARDDEEIKRLILSGQHPLSRIAMCIQMGGHALATLLPHVPDGSADSIRKIIRHLEYIDRYPQAKSELENWIANLK